MPATGATTALMLAFPPLALPTPFEPWPNSLVLTGAGALQLIGGAAHHSTALVLTGH